MHLPINIFTLGDLREHHYSIHVHCNECRHVSILNVLSAIQRLGAAQSIMRYDLAPKLICGECGGRSIFTALQSNSAMFSRDAWKRKLEDDQL